MPAGEIRVGQDMCYREPEASPTEGKWGLFPFLALFIRVKNPRRPQQAPIVSHWTELGHLSLSEPIPGKWQ